jgi:5-histidylcysteine sulfoxide synthase
MIPICRDPKRFVAALNKERFATVVSKKLLLKRNFVTRNAIASVVTSARVNSASLSNGVVSHQLFSTSKLQSEATNASVNVSIMPEPNHSYTDSMKLVGPRDAHWWTGKRPEECPGYVKSTGKLYSLPQLNLGPSCTKQSLQDYFDNTWTLTEVLLSSLQGEEAFMRPPYHDLRHPMIFYYGHPAALYINKLRVAGLLKDPINPYYESIFETGVDEMSWDDLSKNKLPWPSVAEVREYRKKVYKTVTNLIQSLSDAQCSNISQQSPLWALAMGFEHERIHLETSSVLINELPIRFVGFPEGFPKYHPSTPEKRQAVRKPVAGVHYPVNDMIDVPSQTIQIGKPRNFPSYGWDNEYGHREYEVPAFKASKFKISNGEFLEFVKDNGYARRELWTEVGWKWRAFRNVKWPTFWIRVGPQGNHEYDMRLIFDESPMAWNWPVCVNFHEAVAFAQWKSAKTGKNYRILTEVEHRAIRDPEASSSHRVEDDHTMKYAGNDMEKVKTSTIAVLYQLDNNFFLFREGLTRI